MTPDTLARIHADSFPAAEAWSARSIAQTLAAPHVETFTAPDGFAITRTLAGESELLTLAVAPAARRRGTARGLLTQWLDSLEGRAEHAFLEVAIDNCAAISLYENLSFQRTGIRHGYYVAREGGAVDAVLMSRAVTLGHSGSETGKTPDSG